MNELAEYTTMTALELQSAIDQGDKIAYFIASYPPDDDPGYMVWQDQAFDGTKPSRIARMLWTRKAYTDDYPIVAIWRYEAGYSPKLVIVIVEGELFT